MKHERQSIGGSRSQWPRSLLLLFIFWYVQHYARECGIQGRQIEQKIRAKTVNRSNEVMATLAPRVVFTVFEVRASSLKLMKHKWRKLFVVFALNGTILDNDGANL